jgi:hypothetical protein
MTRNAKMNEKNSIESLNSSSNTAPWKANLKTQRKANPKKIARTKMKPKKAKSKMRLRMAKTKLQ